MSEQRPSSGMASAFNNTMIEQFRANGARLGGPFEGRADAAVAHHRREVPPGTGQPEDVPGAQTAGASMFASNAGADTDPDWYHNLVAHLDVTAEIARAPNAFGPAPHRRGTRTDLG